MVLVIIMTVRVNVFLYAHNILLRWGRHCPVCNTSCSLHVNCEGELQWLDLCIYLIVISYAK